MKKKILMIGCGGYAVKHHIPVLLEHQNAGEIEVSAVIVDQKHQSKIERKLHQVGLNTKVKGVPCDIDFDNFEGVRDETIKIVNKLIALHEPHGAIVTLIPVYNYDVTRVCLENGLDVLVEKPAACPPNCCWDINAAEKISSDMENLVTIASKSGVRLLVGAQRRYEKVYQWMRNKGGETKVVEAVHARGWGADGRHIPLKKYRRWRRYPYLTGGKIMLSGYHVLDIVTWWIRNAYGERTKYARVFSSFERHNFNRFLQNGSNNNTEKTAAIQIQFFEDEGCEKLLCLASFLFTTAGPKDWTRETYFVSNDVEDRFTIERDHSRDIRMLSRISKREDGNVNIEKIVTIPKASAGNKKPTRDLIHGLLHNGRPLYKKELSSGSDHLVSAKLIGAVYQSAIQCQPVTVSLR